VVSPLSCVAAGCCNCSRDNVASPDATDLDLQHVFAQPVTPIAAALRVEITAPDEVEQVEDSQADNGLGSQSRAEPSARSRLLPTTGRLTGLPRGRIVVAAKTHVWLRRLLVQGAPQQALGLG
jgi:hypothetical protein